MMLKVFIKQRGICFLCAYVIIFIAFSGFLVACSFKNNIVQNKPNTTLNYYNIDYNDIKYDKPEAIEEPFYIDESEILHINFTSHVVNPINYTDINSPNIVLISWDGVEREVLFQLLRNGLLPNLVKLNVYNMTDNTEFNTATNTKAQHSIMLSGYLSDVTGTKNNYDWNPLVDKSVFSVVKRFIPNYYVAGVITKTLHVAPILLNNESGHYELIYGEFVNRSGFDYVKSEPVHIREKGVVSCEPQLQVAGNCNNFFYFFHFCEPDHNGHRFLGNSSEYRQAIMDCDWALGELEKNLPSDTIYIVTSDHGFHPNAGHHINAPYTFVASNLKLRNGYECDIAPTIYDLLNTTQFVPNLNGQSLWNGEEIN